MSTWKSFEDIEVWQLAREFCQDIYRIIQYDGLKTDYKLKEQINGSSGSIMDNIAEGFERNGNKEFINFLSIAKGSAGESRSQLHRIFDRKYITDQEYNERLVKIKNSSGKIQNQMTYLKNSEFKGTKYK
ncbi:MAG: four helix bundle protein [Flavobacteriales bacterium CG03_land_8_20_14_0_80_35_15]|nr:MAG: four helix bundle protein [Flavobacteriales bacterium CG03_land_8_20_14_0_80_35_15]PIX06563.1 MAG: four helix bundle protein [Flavobacteriales bacterium CG_4_8_14_3_um_filter_35_10]